MKNKDKLTAYIYDDLKRQIQAEQDICRALREDFKAERQEMRQRIDDLLVRAARLKWLLDEMEMDDGNLIITPHGKALFETYKKDMQVIKKETSV